jgi:hypothetical protein
VYFTGPCNSFFEGCPHRTSIVRAASHNLPLLFHLAQEAVKITPFSALYNHRINWVFRVLKMASDYPLKIRAADVAVPHLNQLTLNKSFIGIDFKACTQELFNGHTLGFDSLRQDRNRGLARQAVLRLYNRCRPKMAKPAYG